MLSLAVTPVFGWLVSRFPRQVFVPVVYGGAAVLLVVFHQAHARTEDAQLRLWMGYGFYIFVSTLAVFSTAVFWGLMADGWSDTAARRRFGQVGIGGTLGALVGAEVVDRWPGGAADPDLILVSLPRVNLGGFAMLALAPSVAAYGVFEVLQRGSRFAVMRPAREMPLTVLQRDEKYKAKQSLDTAVYRGTDAGWGWIDTWLRGLLGAFALKIWVVMPVCALWGLLGLRLGRMNAVRRAELVEPTTVSEAGREAREDA